MIDLRATLRPGEHRLVLGASVTLFGILTGHALLETARDVLFLESLPAQQLPWMYLLIAVVSIGLVQLQSLVPHGGSNRAVLGSLIAGSGVVTGLLWWGTAGDPRAWVLYAVYVWAGVFATVVVTRFWLVVEDVFTVTQAKRVFAVIGAGSVLGAIVGSALARVLSDVVDARHFLVIAGVILVATAILPIALLGAREQTMGRDAEGRAPGPEPNWRSAWNVIVHRPYLKRLLGLVVVSTLALTLVDYLFKSIVAQRVEPGDLAGFFSTTYLVLNLVSLVLQVTVVSAILRNFGVDRSLSLTPFLLVLTSILLVIVYTISPLLLLVPALAMKGIDGSLRHSLHRTSTETLFVPLSKAVREQAKAFVDVIGQRGGQAFASLAILVVVMLPGSEVILGVGVVALCVVWIRIARDIRRHYLDLFRDALREQDHLEKGARPELDLASLEKLIEHLNAVNDTEVVAALDVLAEHERTHLIPALILYHPSNLVVVHALELFARSERRDMLPILERIARHEDPTVRACVLRTRARLSPDLELQRRVAREDPSPVVRATALISLTGSDEDQELTAELTRIGREASGEEAMALARSIRMNPDPAHAPLLLAFGERTVDVHLQREIVLAMRAVASPDTIEPLVRLLPHREFRTEVRAALVAIGDPALEALDRALGDEELEHDVRRHVPRTISRFAPDAAGHILIGHLLSVKDGLVRFKILRGLGSLRRRHRDVDLDPRILHQALEETLAGAFRLLDWRAALLQGARRDPRRRTVVHELLLHTLHHKEMHARERLFRYLGLLFPEENWERIHRGIASDRAMDRASASELIAATLDPPLRDGLLGFVDELSDAERLRAGTAFYTPRAWGYEETLSAFLDYGSLGLRCITVHHVGEIGLTTFRDRLNEMRDRPPIMQQQVVGRAIELLEKPEAEPLRHA